MMLSHDFLVAQLLRSRKEAVENDDDLHFPSSAGHLLNVTLLGLFYSVCRIWGSEFLERISSIVWLNLLIFSQMFLHLDPIFLLNCTLQRAAAAASFLLLLHLLIDFLWRCWALLDVVARRECWVYICNDCNANGLATFLKSVRLDSTRQLGPWPLYPTALLTCWISLEARVMPII